MNNNKSKSFNHQVYEKAYKRLHLTPSQRNIFQRLLGFLIRNDKPFPYSAVKLAEITGYDKRTIFRCLDKLEYYRLIKRNGLGKNRRFRRGTILDKILTTVTNRLKRELIKNKTTATLCHQNLNNRDIVSYKKTSSSLKRKEEVGFFSPLYQEYVGKINSGKKLGLISGNAKVLNYEEWNAHANIRE